MQVTKNSKPQTNIPKPYKTDHKNELSVIGFAETLMQPFRGRHKWLTKWMSSLEMTVALCVASSHALDLFVFDLVGCFSQHENSQVVSSQGLEGWKIEHVEITNQSRLGMLILCESFTSSIEGMMRIGNKQCSSL